MHSFDKDQLAQVAEDLPTPFHLYDEANIRRTVKDLNNTFSWIPGFKEYFAVKATPNPHILELLKEEGCGMDCSSLAELMLAEAIGATGDEIMFTSNNTPGGEFRKANEMGAIINFDDITHIPFFEEEVGSMPEIACCRYNPGATREGNTIIGNPIEAKYGFSRDQLFQGYKLLKEKGVKRFGIHTMVASNELQPEFFVETAEMLFKLLKEIEAEIGIKFEFVNVGGGIGIPYHPEDKAVDLESISAGFKDKYRAQIGSFDVPEGSPALKVVMEMGRMITGPSGVLVTQVRHIKQVGNRSFVGVDASMADLMRPGMYDAYHHIEVLGKEDQPHDFVCDVTGSLCENNDKFAIQRPLPEVEKGDYLAICSTGAHGHAMGFNYNGKLRHAEYLLRPDGTPSMIRRAETEEDLFITLNYPGL